MSAHRGRDFLLGLGAYVSLQLRGTSPIEQFLQRYWQRKPVVIRKALLIGRIPSTPDELAGLALEETVDSRLVCTRSAASGKPKRVHSRATTTWAEGLVADCAGAGHWSAESPNWSSRLISSRSGGWMT